MKCKILNTKPKRNIVTILVLKPSSALLPAEIEKCMYDFIENRIEITKRIKIEQNGYADLENMVLLENYQERAGDKKVKKGSWCLTLKILTDNLWTKIVKEGYVELPVETSVTKLKDALIGKNWQPARKIKKDLLREFIEE